MSVLNAILGVGGPPVESRALSYQSLFERGLDYLNVGSNAGVSVNAESALRLSAVWACVRILSDGVATLPVTATRGRGSQSELVVRPPAWIEDPNPALRRIDVMSQAMVSLLLTGNAYLLTVRDRDGFVIELWPVDPAMIEVEVDTSKLVRKPSYRAGGVPLSALDLLHVRGICKPGEQTGMSPIAYAKESIGLGLAAQTYGASFFANGALPGGIVESPGQMSDTGVAMLKAAWNELHRGSGNGSKLAVLTEGAKFAQVAVPPEQAQFLETRRFQVADIARIFGVPPHLVGDASGSTSWGSGLAEQSTNYVVHSLRPWVERFEEAFTWLARSERPTVGGQRQLFVNLDLDHLMRGDFATRINTYATAIGRGIYTVDEVRQWEGLRPSPESVTPVASAGTPTGD